MNRKMFDAMYKMIKEAYDRNVIETIIDILSEAGYGGYIAYRNGECYDRDVKTVRRQEYGRFLYAYAHEILFYRFDA